ncbi:MAG: pitrilysin family protein [Pseudomonadales bacterium]
MLNAKAGLLALTLMLAPVILIASDLFDLDVDIPYTLFKLDNGLTVIVHEDHKAPVVAVNIWYHVGSKDEVRGRTGFAHLFEHLMFNGSENYDDDYFAATEKLGATTLNGTTSWDRTNYFQTVPVNGLDSILWLESDRMGNLLGAITQEKLDEQRGVVQNEKRQRLNAPYGKGAEIQYSSIYPYTHPYSWTTIGSMEDLNAAALSDVHEWFKKYYGANNAVVVLAGDITVEQARQKMEHYFGFIEPGPPLTKHESWVAKLTGTQKEISYDRVPQTMMMKSWNIEGNSTRDTNLLSLVANVLTSGKSSRLYKRLVYDEQLVSSVNAYTSTGEIAGTFEITAMINPGVDEKKVDRIIDEELARFLQKGPTRKELKQVKVEVISGFVRGIEKVGGFGGKSDILASNYTYTGDPGYYKKELEWIKNATSNELKAVANKWLTDGLYQLEIRPYPGGAPKPETVDRSGLPTPGEPPRTSFDDFKRATLENGLRVIVAERHAIPVVQMQLSVDAGYASDQHTKPGVAKLAMNMLDEGTKKRSALDISDELIMLGASISTGSNLDTSFVGLSSLTTTLADSLALFADVTLNPSFPADELPRLRIQQLTAIQREQSSPNSMASRTFPKLIYGEGHAYSNPLTGSGTLESVAAIDLAELKAFHEQWFKPNHATLIVVGDTTMDDILPRIEKHFGNWQAGDIPTKDISSVDRKEDIELYLVDRPGSEQSVLLAGVITVPKANPDEVAIEAMNDVLGGMSTSRINMNLREDKGWSYGAYTGLINARGQRIHYMITSVQTDKTKEAIAEVMSEMRAFVSSDPVTAAELEKSIKNNSLSLAGRWETAGSVLGSLSQLVQYRLPDDYFKQYPGKVAALTTDQVSRVANRIIQPESLVWVVVGDRAVIEPGLAELGYGPVKLIDPDGNLLE